MSIKLGSFADISPLLDRQIEELVAAAQQTQEELGLVVATPSAITALTTEGGWGNILLNYSYTNYNGHLYTEIWRSADAIFANGHAVGATAAKFYTDAPENAQLTDVYYYWVRNVNLEGDTSDWYGPASGSIAAVSSFNVDDLLGQLGFEHFASGTMPIRSEAVLPDLSTTPANYPVGSIIYLTSNQLLYKNVAWVWKELIAAEDMVGEITETQIADGSISTPKLQAQSVTANELMANSVIAGKIAAGALAVDDGVMQNGYIKNALIANGAITNAKISGVIYSELQYAGQPAWELNKNGNLIIRGTSGLPIFQSGGTLDFADVSGLTKPADNADATDYTTINNDISTAQTTAEANAKAHADAQDVLYETSNKNYTESWSAQGADVTAAALSATTQITEGGLIMLNNTSGDYVQMTPAAMQFVDVSNAANNLTWANGTLTLPNACINQAQINGAIIDTAQIADGAIKTAKIGNAQVDTLQLAGECIFVPRGVTPSSSTVGTTTETTISDTGYFTIDTAGQTILITLDVYLNVYAGSHDSARGEIKLYGGSGGTLLKTITSATYNDGDGTTINDTYLIKTTSVAGSNKIRATLKSYYLGGDVHAYAAILVQAVQK